MQRDLLRLLQARKVSHPSKIVSATIKANRELSIVVKGFPWWKENALIGDDDEVEFLFIDVVDGALKFSDFAREWWDEALEPFEISETSHHSWANGDGYELFCSTPLKNPLGLYAALQGYLTSVGSLHGPKHFLNFGGSDSFDLFLKYTSSRSYLLSRAPETVSNFLAILLELENVPFRRSSTKLESCGSLLVRIGDSTFFCEKAVARFE